MKVEIEAEPLAAMRSRGGRWAAYQNVALDSANLGHCQFLQFGLGRTFIEPPKTMPDTAWGAGWKYTYQGEVNLETGEVIAVSGG